MLKYYINIFFISSLICQDCLDNRYIDEIFEVEIITNIQYGSNYNDNWGNIELQQLYMDIYQPAGDDINNRPLIFFLFGGGFIFGDRTSNDIVSLCHGYAKRGYVAVAIDYRLTTSLLFDNSLTNVYSAVIKSVHDLKAAIRFFRMSFETENQYRIDQNRIFVGGTSAGSISAIHTAYLDENDIIPFEINTILQNTGGYEGESGNPGYNSEIHGVINLCGAIGDESWLGTINQPIVSLHGTNDITVPYGEGINVLGITSYGSSIIHSRMLELGNDSQLYTDEGGGHCDFISNMDFVNQFTSNFMYNHVCNSDNFLIGDINWDGIINVIDILITVNLIIYSEFDNYADLNADNQINVLDIVLMVNIILD